MKLYQVHRTCEGGCSAGYEFFTNLKDAKRAATVWVRDNEDEKATVTVIKIMPSKAGILSALKKFASHPDNG